MELIVISLGGSLIVPEHINTNFLKRFRAFIRRQLKTKRFILIVGGGATARNYIAAASAVAALKRDDLDWIGIHTTRLNGQLLKAVFKEAAYKRIIRDPRERVNFKHVLIAAGWKPGCSTDYDAVMLAKTYKTGTLINLTNVDYVYDKNPKKYRDARPIKKMGWKQFRKIVGKKWRPGLSTPFDPIASKLAQKQKLRVVIMNGKNINNLERFLKGKQFIGTTIE